MTLQSSAPTTCGPLYRTTSASTKQGCFYADCEVVATCVTIGTTRTVGAAETAGEHLRLVRRVEASEFERFIGGCFE